MKIDELINYGSTWDDEVAEFMLSRLGGDVSADELLDGLVQFEGRPQLQGKLLTKARGYWDGLDVWTLVDICACVPRELGEPLVVAYLKQAREQLSFDDLIVLRDAVGEGASPELESLLDPAEGRVLSAEQLLELMDASEDDIARREIAKGTRLSFEELCLVLDRVFDTGAIVTMAIDKGMRFTPDQASTLLASYDIDDVDALVKATDGVWSIEQIEDLALSSAGLGVSTRLLIDAAHAGHISSAEEAESLLITAIEDDCQLAFIDALIDGGTMPSPDLLLSIIGDIDARHLRRFVGALEAPLQSDECQALCAMCPDLDDTTAKAVLAQADLDEEELLDFADMFSERASVRGHDGTPLIKDDGISFLFDDRQRKWREDAQEYMTDWEYTDWYEGYYYDPNNPY